MNEHAKAIHEAAKILLVGYDNARKKHVQDLSEIERHVLQMGRDNIALLADISSKMINPKQPHTTKEEPPHTTKEPQREKWEYQFFEGDGYNLNIAGQDGWEIFQIDGNRAFAKRRLL